MGFRFSSRLHKYKCMGGGGAEKIAFPPIKAYGTGSFLYWQMGHTYTGHEHHNIDSRVL